VKFFLIILLHLELEFTIKKTRLLIKTWFFTFYHSSMLIQNWLKSLYKKIYMISIKDQRWLSFKNFHKRIDSRFDLALAEISLIDHIGLKY
jgi:hypothetical protein